MCTEGTGSFVLVTEWRLSPPLCSQKASGKSGSVHHTGA